MLKLTTEGKKMAYFKSNESNQEEPYLPDEAPEEYDDGFDELTGGEEDPELTEEELAERTRSRFRIAMGAGNLVAVIGGAVLILLLLTMIFSMVYFVMNDMNRNFSLFSTHF